MISINTFSNTLSYSLKYTTRLVKIKSSFREMSRIPAAEAQLDVNFIVSNLDLVVSHLKSRKSNIDLIQNVEKLQKLRENRNLLIMDGDSARSSRKKLSQQIGKLMKEGNDAEVAELKKTVEDLSAVTEKSDKLLAGVDNEINDIFQVIPNLLDDRYVIYHFISKHLNMKCPSNLL